MVGIKNSIVSLTSLAATLLLPGTASADSNSSGETVYSPVRPPAIPLAVRDPYSSLWSPTANDTAINTHKVMFWAEHFVGWDGLVTVDGKTYQWLGTDVQDSDEDYSKDVKTADLKSVTFDSQNSNFTFDVDGVELFANFFSPVIPDDLCRSSIPLSYLTVSAKSTDGKDHEVQLYNEMASDVVTYNKESTLNWNLYRDGKVVGDDDSSQSANKSKNSSSSSVIHSWFWGKKDPMAFGEESDFPTDGNYTFSTTQGKADNFSYQAGYSNDVRKAYVSKQQLKQTIDTDYRSYSDKLPVFAYAHDLGKVSGDDDEASSVLYTIGTLRQKSISYTNIKNDTETLGPWWGKCYGSEFDVIDFHYKDLEKAQEKALKMENQIQKDVGKYFNKKDIQFVNPEGSMDTHYKNNSKNEYDQEYIFSDSNTFGFMDPKEYTGVAVPDSTEENSYYAILALSVRQIMMAYMITEPSKEVKSDEPLIFQKEISSNGNMNTVDVMFPAMPFFLYTSPDFLRLNIEPLFQNQENGLYPNKYSIHDLGTHFPNATGHPDGNDEYMPVEECGNMVMMCYGYYKFTGDKDYLKKHYDILKQWNDYLVEFSLTPSHQISTDDFAGPLVNQSNLAVKGLIGISTMSKIADVLGKEDDAKNFSSIAKDYYNQWKGFAISPDNKHTLLSYNWRSSWGILYNIYADKLLDIGIIEDEIFKMQSKWYPTVSQEFGIPLDNRHSYTKSDWQVWAAAVAEPDTRRLILTSMAYWLNNTNTGEPFSDWYDVVSGEFNPDGHFLSRPVVGGHFALLADQASKEKDN